MPALDYDLLDFNARDEIDSETWTDPSAAALFEEITGRPLRPADLL